MDKDTRPETPAGMRRNHQGQAVQPPLSAGMIDQTMFREFFSLLGTTQALLWLAQFRDELHEEFARPQGQTRDVHASRRNIHNFCGRAGFIGFTALHEACLGFLDAENGKDFPDAKYGHVRKEAQRACAEIARQHARQV